MLYIIGIFVLFLSLFLFHELKHFYMRAFTFKALTSFTFLVLAMGAVFTSPTQNIETFWPIYLSFLIALCFGAMGDIQLALRPLRKESENENLILSGIFFFSSGHMIYYGALISLGGFYLGPWFFSVVVTGLVVWSSISMKFQMGKAKLPSYLYSFIIFLMVGQTIWLYSNHGSTFYLLMSLGAVLFGISDLILAFVYFKNSRSKWVVASNLITYYSAQALIAISLFYLGG